MKDDMHKRYLIILLMMALAFSYMDRFALGLVLQDIKRDFNVTDTQLGFLTGLAFAVFYSLMGLPIARWADRNDRIKIISTTVALWSITVCLCGLAANFVQLLLIRIGVAVGEAGCLPPAHSLIADVFSREERPRAVATYMLGGSLSVVFGYFIAGWLNQAFGWRWMFFFLGLPGVLLAALILTTLTDHRRAIPRTNQTTVDSPSVRDVAVTLFGNTTFRHLLFCFSIASFFGYGILQWLPAFFTRSFGLQSRELGAWLTLVYGGAGLVGTYIGGRWASRYAAGNEPLQLKVMAIAYVAFGILSACMYLSSNRYVSFACLALAMGGSAITTGPMFATIQTLVPAPMRATSIALIYLFANLIGMGLGPLAAGALSDALAPRFGNESLRYALLILCTGYLWVGWHVWRASVTVTRDLAESPSPPSVDRGRV